MNCPHCGSTTTTQLTAKTSLGYPTFRCSACGRKFNERTCTVYNNLQFPTDVVMLVVLWRIRYKGYTAFGILQKCSWCAASSLLMKQLGIGKLASPHSSQSNSAPDDGARQGVPGTWTRLTCV